MNPDPETQAELLRLRVALAERNEALTRSRYREERLAIQVGELTRLVYRFGGSTETVFEALQAAGVFE